MNKLTKNNKLTLFTSLFIIIFILIMLPFGKNNEDIYFVNKQLLFENFNMTNQIIKATNKEFNNRKREVDSLYFFIKKNNSSNEKLNLLYFNKKKELIEFKEKTILAETNKIWERINTYTKQFGNEKGYKLILSSYEQQSNVFYASKSIDITNDLLNYINAKYEGQ